MQANLRRDSSAMDDVTMDSDELSSPFFSEVDLSGGDSRVIPFELRRDNVPTLENPNGTWENIKVGSLDWRQTEKQYPDALVVRVSAIVSSSATHSRASNEQLVQDEENQSLSAPEKIVKMFRIFVSSYPAVDSALHVVCMFKEFSVAENSPLRYTANFWFIFPESSRVDHAQFEVSVADLLPERCISYVTFEMLTSFLSRREYEAKIITSSEAKSRLQNHIMNNQPCSSLFLKLSPEFPQFCRQLLQKIEAGTSKYLAGVRAIHKLAVSCTSSQMSSQHNYNETLNVMKLGVHPKDWSFVVFKTLTRLATKNDRTRKINPIRNPSESHVVQMLDIMDNSNLQFVEKLAIRIIAKDYRSPPSADSAVESLVEFLHKIIVSSEDFISDEDFLKLHSLINDGAPSTCHLTGVLLEKCVEEENFNIGWKIASIVESVNEHTIEEIVTLCSKAFFKFSRTDKAEANVWFDRVHWCVERHYKLLGKYPSGLALHVAAHRGDFELCWKWFTAKRDEKAFRFTAHHTSSVFKAATYAKEPLTHMDEVFQAYKMTPHKEKSPFVFEPLYHLWGITESVRDQHWNFWEIVHRDLKQYLDLNQSQSTDENSMRKVRKLGVWASSIDEWKNGGSGNFRGQGNRRPYRRVSSTPGAVDSTPKSLQNPQENSGLKPQNRRRMSETITSSTPAQQAVQSKSPDISLNWRKDGEEVDSKGSTSPTSSKSPDSPTSVLRSNREGSPLNAVFSEPQGAFFGAKNFSSFQFAREDSSSNARSISPPGTVHEGQNSDPVYIPPATKSLGVPVAPVRSSFPLHFGSSDNIWSPAYSNEKETHLWEKSQIQPLKFVTSSLGSVLDR